MKELLHIEQYLEYFDGNDENAYKNFGMALKDKILEYRIDEQPIVILCIGTDRATGDCLGPLIGNNLRRVDNINVYGTLAHPIHALNLSSTLEDIRLTYENPFIIAIDASLGITKHIGFITLSTSPIEPGKGVEKKLPAIGNLSITGIVNISGFPGSILLQSTRLHTVMQLSKCISKGIKYCLDTIDY